jgi:hypothetical protein
VQMAALLNFQLPPAMYYAVSYTSKEGSSTNSNGSNVSVSVEQYPNSPWAFHLADYFTILSTIRNTMRIECSWDAKRFASLLHPASPQG